MMTMRSALPLALLVAGCSGSFTSPGLTGEAERAVVARLGGTGTISFEGVQSVADEHMACGHVVVRDAAGKTLNEQDFVYADRRVLFDNEPDYAMAAVSCDEAQADGNS